MSDHTLGSCSSPRLCGHPLRVRESRRCVCRVTSLNTREGLPTPQGGLNAMSSNVFVINQNGHPLMPCHPAKARKLLRDGKARVIGRCPFTIKLLWDCEEQVQEVVLGIDKGSHSTGFCCVGKRQILLSGEIYHRLDIRRKWTAVAIIAETAATESGIDRKGFSIGHRANAVDACRLLSKPMLRR